MKKTLIGAMGAIVIAGVSFLGGSAYGKSQVPVGTARASGQFYAAGGNSGGFAGRMGRASGSGGFAAGKIISVGNGNLSIQQQNSSSSEIVLTSASTQILKTISGSNSDLTPGTDIVVTGTPNSDGSLTAQSIEIHPAGTAAPIMRYQGAAPTSGQ